ncbi:Uncharacterised protein [Mycobacteroides abscessus subsp. abscessus]|nr:Uncharacterised protein [Mycobacteroides abscessus subsp. abscessus]
MAIFGRTRSSWSLLPWANSVGPNKNMPFWLMRAGAPALKYSSSKITHCSSVTSRPPYSLGQDTAENPASYRVRSHCRCATAPSGES